MKSFRGICGKTFQLLDGENIPLFGLGTYSLFTQDEVNQAVDTALASGYRLFDTANYYANENELGNAFEKLLPKHNLTRNDIYIITKANICSSNVKQSAKKMIDHSLTSLKTNYLDLVLIHYPKDWGVSDSNPDNKQHRLQIYKVLEEYKHADKIRSIGVANFESHHIDELWNEVSVKPTVNQCEFHPHLTRASLVNYCKEKGILFQAHTSLAKNTRSLFDSPILIEIAKRHNASVTQVLLAFSYAQQISVIPKSKDKSRIIENIKAVDIILSHEEITKLNSLNRDAQYSDCDGWNVV